MQKNHSWITKNLMDPFEVWRFVSQSVTLTEAVRRGIKRLQLGAAAQELRTDILHAVPAHVQQLHLGQAQRCAQLSDAVTEKKMMKNG